jgi:hypothetical protein
MHMLKLALLGAAGYAGYKYYEKNMKTRQGGTPEVPLMSEAERRDETMEQSPATPVPI